MVVTTVSMHDDAFGAVLVADDSFLVGAERVRPGDRPTFDPDLPLRHWGPVRLADRGLAVVGNWITRPKPRFSARGQGGMTLKVANTRSLSVPPIPIDVFVRRDPGLLGFRTFGD
jgi:hypothetical protein